MPDTYTIRFPWPSATLSPNARVHHMQLAKAKSRARDAAYYLGIEAGCRALRWSHARLHWTFHPPRRGYDDDNLETRMKSARDGVADCLGTDDRHWIATRTVAEPRPPHGEVVLTITKGD